MSKPKKSAKIASRTATPAATPRQLRQRVKVLGPNFKVRWEWREVA